MDTCPDTSVISYLEYRHYHSYLLCEALVFIMMLGSKVFLPLTDAYGLLRCFATLVILKHSQYANLMRKLLLAHV